MKIFFTVIILGTWITVIVFLVSVGFIVITNSSREIWQGIQSNRWPIIQGQVTGFKIDRFDDGMSAVTYSYQLSFVYFVRGIEYRSKSYIRGNFGSYKAAEKFVLTQYPVGQSIPVFYHPQKPHIFTLTPGLRLGMFMRFLIGFIFFSPSVFIVLHLLIWISAFWLIGPPPETGCNQPNLLTRKWVTVSCPPPGTSYAP